MLYGNIPISPNMIMIVDDSALIRAMIKEHVHTTTNGKHEVYECSDGREAVEGYRQFRPELVLMDIKMKPMDGLAATHAIRRQFPDAKIIIVSNFDDPDLREAARKSGASGYVLKERLFELDRMIRNSL